MSSLVHFDAFDVDLRSGQLTRSGVRVHLRDKSFQVLACLLEHPGQVVTRAELRGRLWPDDVFVDFENNLNTAVARLRLALGDSAGHPRYIETLPKRGYRFLGDTGHGNTTSQLSTATAAAGRGVRRLTDDAAAYNEYILARHDMNAGTAEALTRAGRRLEQAIERDAEFADAYDALAEVYWYQAYFGFMPPREAFAAAIVHAVRALEIDNTRAETHALLGELHKISGYNWPEVAREMRIALRLDPSPVVRMRYAVSDLMPHGHVREAVAELEGALQVDPLSLAARFWLAVVLLLAREPDRAFAESHRLLELDPTYAGAYFIAGSCHRCRRMFPEAIAAHRKTVELSGGAAVHLGWLGLTLGEAGDRVAAHDVLRRLHQIAAQRHVPPCCFAWVHLGIGETDAAFEWMDRAVEECDQLMMPIKSYAFLDPVRTDSRFAALLRKMNLDS